MGLWRQMLFGHEGHAGRVHEVGAGHASEHACEGGHIAAARSLRGGGDLAGALAAAAAAIERAPDDPQGEHARGLVLTVWRRYREAQAAFRRALACGAGSAEFFIDAGWCDYLLGDLDAAEQHHAMGVAAGPDCAEAQFALGVVLRARSDHGGALSRFMQVESLSPNYPECALNIAMCQRGLGDTAAAEVWLRRALEQNGRDSRIWGELGLVFVSQERYEDAFEAFRRARVLEVETGNDARSLPQHAASLVELGRAAEAVDLCERELPVSSDYSAHSLYAFALLTRGRLRDGWEQYEYRWFEEPMRSARARYPVPIWAGQPLAGKAILLRAEQGFGDVFQFARYATPLKALGASVLMQVHNGIAELAQSFDDVDRVLPKDEPFTRFDYYINMMSLPRAFATDLATVPSRVPYLHADRSRTGRWTQRIAHLGELKVGLVWAGNPDHKRDRIRSIPLEEFSALWRIPGVRFVSLQKLPRAGDGEKMPDASVMLDLGPELDDFADTAALVDGLDLVICVDTAVAHLAGAMAKPVWLLLPTVVDFRWMEEREDSPWYPTMRLFRQARPGEWSGVVQRVCEDLRKLAAGDRSVLRPSPPPETPAREGAVPAFDAQRIARVTEARDGILQYLPSLDAEARSIAWYGEHLSSQLDVVARVVPMDAHIVEVGAGVGAHALWFLKVLGPQAQLFLYEHRDIVRRILAQNLEANGVSARATRVRGTIGGAGGSLAPGSEPPAHTLDDLRLARLDLLKIEVADLVPDVLDGAEATLWRLRPRLLLAVRDARSLAESSLRIKAFGYRCWRIEAPLFNPGNFNRRDNDIFDGAAWLGLLAIPEESDVGSWLATNSEV